MIRAQFMSLLPGELIFNTYNLIAESCDGFNEVDVPAGSFMIVIRNDEAHACVLHESLGMVLLCATWNSGAVTRLVG